MYMYLVRDLIFLSPMFLQRSVDVSVPLVDSGTKLQHVEVPRVVAVSSETIDAVITTDTSGSLEEGNIIGDLYGSCHSVAPVHEAVASSGGIDACMKSPSYDASDLGVIAESVDVGSCSSVIDSQPRIDSCDSS
jgi:hypothetical protein